MTFQLEKPQLQYIGLRVKDLGGAVLFYEKIPGFYLASQENNLGYFSSGKKQNVFLVVEGIPSGEFEKGKRKLQRLTFQVKTLEDMAKLQEFFQAEDIPYKEDKKGNQEFTLTIHDPEENQLSFTFNENSKQQTSTYQLANLEMYLYFEKEAKTFFAENLKFAAERNYYAVNEMQGFTVTYGKEEKAMLSHELGIDFIVLNVETKNNLEELVAYFDEKQIPYYRDKKLTLVTVYDPNQIEWWFTVKKDQTEKKCDAKAD